MTMAEASLVADWAVGSAQGVNVSGVLAHAARRGPATIRGEVGRGNDDRVEAVARALARPGYDGITAVDRSRAEYTALERLYGGDGNSGPL